MIFINKNSVLGSKKFTLELASAIRQDLQACLNADDFEDFELDLMQNMVHFGEFSKQDFNTVFDIIRQQDNLDKDWQKKLVEQMKQDERFEPKTPFDNYLKNGNLV